MSLLAYGTTPVVFFYSEHYLKKYNLLIEQRLMEFILQENAISVSLLLDAMFNLMCYLY